MGRIEIFDGVTSAWKVPFLWMFLFFFFFLGVQTFNAIINYSYNRASEDMKDQFKHEENERQRKQSQKKKNSKKKTSLSHLLWKFIHPKSAEEAKEDAPEAGLADGDATSSLEALEIPVAEVPDPELDQLDQAVREKVLEYQNRVKDQSSKDGICTIIMYIVMVCCYIWFVFVNMRVEAKGNIRNAIANAVHAVEVPLNAMTEQGPYMDMMNWNEILTLEHSVLWISQGLPMLIFNSTSATNVASGVDRGFLSPDSICIKTWNCLVSGSAFGDEGTGVVRITQRRSVADQNVGARTFMTPEDDRFIGGTTNTSGGVVSNAMLLTDTAGFATSIPGSSAGMVAEEKVTNFSLSYNRTTDSGSTMVQFCDTRLPGEPGSFQRNGGIVCMLDANAQIFQEQMNIMLANGFFQKSSANFLVEMVTHNANRGLLSFITLELMTTPSGRVVKDLQIATVALFGLEVAVDKLGQIIGRLAPGIIYIVVVMIFTAMLYRELKRDHTRRSPSSPGEGKKSFLRNLPSLMGNDTFRPIDALSFALSFASFLLFMLWLAQDADMVYMLQKDYSDFVDFVSSLTLQEKLYNRISAANLLLIFVRPLRFMRENAQISRLNSTLHQAQEDIFWFICSLGVFLVACTLLAHVSFGPNLTQMNTLPSALVYCFNFMIGSYDGFWPLYEANSFMAVIFFFPYLILTYCVCMNIFFAILDRFYISADVPPLNFKQKLKPVFSKICRCIDWDDDFVLEEDPKEKKEGPMSRAARVEETALAIKEIKMRGTGADPNSRREVGLGLADICDPDERLNAVIRWSREEAKGIVDDFKRLKDRKQEAKNIDIFIKQLVMKRFDAEAEKSKKEMEEAFRQMQYHAEVHELMAVRDQQTLSRYIIILEEHIKKKMVEQYGLSLEVQHLRTELDNMRYSKADLKQLNKSQSEPIEDVQSSVEASETEEGDDDDNEEDGPGLIDDGGARDPNTVADIEEKPRDDKMTANMLEKLSSL